MPNLLFGENGIILCQGYSILCEVQVRGIGIGWNSRPDKNLILPRMSNVECRQGSPAYPVAYKL